MYTFPELLKKIREGGNLTQEELAKVLGVSTVLITMLETSQKEASKDFVLRLAEKLEVRPDSIIPFIFIDKDHPTRISRIEKGLINLGEKLQVYLIKKKSKRLKQYA